MSEDFSTDILSPNSRSSGILLHITSLPSRYGIGDLGENAYRFIDFLKQSGQSLWQMLPTLHTGSSSSPYTSCSAFAGNPCLIDLDNLVFEGFLTEEEVSDIPDSFSDHQVKYREVIPWKEKLLEKAAARFFVEYSDIAARIKEGAEIDPMRLMLFQDFDRFTLSAQEWLNSYVLFMASRADRINYYLFVQFFFDRQWRALRRYAHKQGVRLIGDVPIYVSPDSVETWVHPELFQMDERGELTSVAGVPPDYFSETGQTWNNPLYDWAGHRQELTDWWIRRIRHQLQHFDVLRLDHFRGFESYWSIPAGSEDARSGHWEPGPGIGFFNDLRDALEGSLPLIAEDLGDITDEVRTLLAETHLPGMKVLQFAFEAEDSAYLPHRYDTENCICYTGTHDNDTTRGWFDHADEAVRGRAVRYLEEMLPDTRVDDESIAASMIRAAISSKACMAVFPMQDVLGLGSEARMNLPGIAEGNWGWRFTWDQVSEKEIKFLKDCSIMYNRR